MRRIQRAVFSPLSLVIVLIHNDYNWLLTAYSLFPSGTVRGLPSEGSVATGGEIMESMQEAAIVTAISIVNRSLGFYHAVAAKVNDLKTRQIFKQIALEETELLRDFCSMYQGSGDHLVEVLRANTLYTNPYYCLLIDSIDQATSEVDALKIALEEKHACIDWYTVFLDTLRDPDVIDVFISVINKTRKQCEAIRDEYARIFEKQGGTIIINNFERNNRRRVKQPVQHDRYLFQAR